MLRSIQIARRIKPDYNKVWERSSTLVEIMQNVVNENAECRVQSAERERERASDRAYVIQLEYKYEKK